MKSGISPSSISETSSLPSFNDESQEVTQSDLNLFLDQITREEMMAATKNEMGTIEVPRKIVEHFNRGRVSGFDECGYFVYRGVKVFEQGKRAEAEARERLTMEQAKFGAVR